MEKQNFFRLLALKHVTLALLVTSVKSEESVHNNKCTVSSNKHSTLHTCNTSSDLQYDILLSNQTNDELTIEQLFIDCNNYQEDDYTEFIKGLNISTTSIRKISIRNCPVPNLPFFADFLHIQNLETLELIKMTKGYRLQPSHFQKFNLSSIKNLRIEYINITDLPENLFENMSNLEALDLVVHQCAKLPAKIFESLKKLAYLAMSFDNLTSLETKIFEHLENLRSLHIYNTPLQYLPTLVFSSLQNLTYLELLNTNISSLQDPIFDNLCELDTLNIFENNRLTHLSDRLFQNNPKLSYIYITKNKKLSNLPEMLFHNLKTIQSISLSGNQLINLTENHFKGLTTLEILSLSKRSITMNALESLKKNLKIEQLLVDEE